MYLDQLRESFPNGHPGFIPLAVNEIALHSAKNADYAKGGDPLGNFKRVSSELARWGINIPPSGVALVYMMKQIDAVGNMMGQKYNGKVEGVGDRLRDIGVYAKIIQILIEEEEKSPSV